MGIRNPFLVELKVEGLRLVMHITGDKREADIFVKNTAAPSVQQTHSKVYQ